MTNPYGQPQQPYGQQPPPGYGPPSGGMPVPYGQPAPYGAPGGMPGGGGGDINAIKDYKGWAIGCIFLFWIIAIFAIMKSNEVNTYKMQGNYVMAEQASKSTKTLCLIASIIGGISCLFAIVWIVFVVILASSATTYSSCYGSYC